MVRTQSMTTLEMEIALMKHFKIRKNIIVPNVKWGINYNGVDLHECDILMLRPSGYAVETEIKISKPDLLKDIKKIHGHNHAYISEFYFAVPEELKEIALEVIPERSGLFIVKPVTARYHSRIGGGMYDKTELTPVCVKSPKINKYRVKWADKDRRRLAELGCMRILTLKQNILNLKK